MTGGFDLVTDNGKFAARILVAQANKASADTSRRVARKHLELQQNGIPTGGTRPFGWQADKRTIERPRPPSCAPPSPGSSPGLRSVP